MAHRILIIEDQLDARELLQDFLEFVGYETLLAKDGEEGEKIAKRELPDLILLDISLPIMSGWDVAKSLRKEDSTVNIPIIALTAHVRPEDEKYAQEVGCSGFIPKPVKPKDVVIAIQNLLGPNLVDHE